MNKHLNISVFEQFYKSVHDRFKKAMLIHSLIHLLEFWIQNTVYLEKMGKESWKKRSFILAKT